MALNDREQIHHQLLDALYTAKKQVEYLEAALSHNAAYLGTGVERDGKFGVKPEDMVAPHALIRYLELVEPEADISDYIGSEGVDHTRPRLGPDAPPSIRPNKKPPVNPMVGNVALGHPDDLISFPFTAGALPPGTYLETNDRGGDEQKNSSNKGESVRPVSSGPIRRGQKGQSAGANIVVPAASAHVLVENVPTPQGGAALPGFQLNDKIIPSIEEPGAVSSSNLVQGAAVTEAAAGPTRPVTDEDCLRAHNAMSALNYGLWDWNMRTGDIFISSRWEELLGRPPAPLSSALDALVWNIHPDDAERVRSSLKGLLTDAAAGMNMPVRYGKAEKDGNWLTGRLYAAYQRQGGKPTRLTAVFAVSEKSDEKAQSQTPTDSLRAFFSGIEEGFALFQRREKNAADGQKHETFALLFMNKPFRNMCGLKNYNGGELTLEQAVGAGLDEWQSSLARVAREKKQIRMPLVCGTDRCFYEVSAFSPSTGLVACIAKNITEPHRLEQEALRNEARLVALYRLSHMDDDSEDRMVRYCLKEAVRLTGSEFGYVYLAPWSGDEEGRVYWSSELLARNGSEPAYPNFRGAPWSNQPESLSLNGPEVVNAIEDAMSRAFGGSVAVSRYMLVPIMEGGRILCVAAVANKKANYEATDQRQLDLFINGMWFHLQRRRAVKDLQRAKDAAEAASNAKNEFLANISHELRTPLNGMLGMLQVLEKSELSKEQMECVRTAAGSGRSLLRVISDILDFARMEAGGLELVRQTFDFKATVKATMGLFTYEAERRQVAFSFTLDENIPRLLVGDEARVRQILFNLVGNALKFTPQGEVWVECSLLPYKKNGRPCIYIAVHDTGIGVSPEKLGAIFQAFTQIDGSSTRRYSGAGIGLAIVGRLVHLMEGSITVDSEPGMGSVIHCSLPFDEAPDSVFLPQPAAAPIKPASALEILAVEDDPVNQFTLRTLLKKAGHSVTCVANGRQAVEALLLRPFHCVITDIQMPVMDGGEFVRRIRQGVTGDIEPSSAVLELLGFEKNAPVLAIPKDIPIVALTAHALSGDRERFLAMGINYYLSKPLSASELDLVLSDISQKIHARSQQQ